MYRGGLKSKMEMMTGQVPNDGSTDRSTPRVPQSGKSASLHHDLADFLNLLAAEWIFEPENLKAHQGLAVDVDHRSHDVVDQVLPMRIDGAHDLVLFTREGLEEIGEGPRRSRGLGCPRSPA
jgi:hypothetical protein